MTPGAWLPASDWNGPGLGGFPGLPGLGDGDVHVWRVPLAPPAHMVGALARLLDDDERDRAARFHFERDRIAYSVVRGALRSVAGHYLGCAGDALRFGYRDKGKPFLAAPPGDLRFNVSHSGDVGLLGFARGRELGVDVERRRPLSDLLALARASFSAAEYAALCRLPPAEHGDAFFACWSRKEAFIKATGEGVSQLAEFDVSVGPDEPARLLRTPEPPGAPGAPRWVLHDLPAIPDHAAALVVEAGAALPAVTRIDCWTWPAQ